MCMSRLCRKRTQQAHLSLTPWLAWILSLVPLGDTTTGCCAWCVQLALQISWCYHAWQHASSEKCARWIGLTSCQDKMKFANDPVHWVKMLQYLCHSKNLKKLANRLSHVNNLYVWARFSCFPCMHCHFAEEGSLVMQHWVSMESTAWPGRVKYNCWKLLPVQLCRDHQRLTDTQDVLVRLSCDEVLLENRVLALHHISPPIGHEAHAVGTVLYYCFWRPAPQQENPHKPVLPG